MKFLLIAFVLVFCSFNGVKSEKEAVEPNFLNRIPTLISRARNGLNRAVKYVIESQRDNFATGWPELGIQPLDPLPLDHIILTPDEFPGFTTFQMELNNTIVRGLGEYKVQNVNVRPAALSAVISLQYDKLDFEGYHNTTSTFFNGVFPITASGNGPYTMRLNNIYLSFIVQLDLINFQFIRLNELRINYLIGVANTNFTGFGPIVTPAFNALAAVGIPIFLDLKQIELNQRIKDEIVPLVNEFIFTDITIADLFSILLTFTKNTAVNALIDFAQSLICHL